MLCFVKSENTVTRELKQKRPFLQTTINIFPLLKNAIIFIIIIIITLFIIIIIIIIIIIFINIIIIVIINAIIIIFWLITTANTNANKHGQQQTTRSPNDSRTTQIVLSLSNVSDSGQGFFAEVASNTSVPSIIPSNRSIYQNKN